MRSMSDPVPVRFNMARYCLADRPADRVGLVVATEGDAEEWTYGNLRDATLRIARGFRALGLRPGDRVMFRLSNEASYPIGFFAAVAAGLVAVPTSAALTPAEARFVLQDAGATAIVVGFG